MSSAILSLHCEHGSRSLAKAVLTLKDALARPCGMRVATFKCFPRPLADICKPFIAAEPCPPSDRNPPSAAKATVER